MDYDYDHSSSDEEDIDDLNFVTFLCQPRRHKARVYKNRSDHFLEWDDMDFYHRFRLSKRVINCVLDLIKDDIKSPTDW